MSANHRFETLGEMLRHGGNVAVRCYCGHTGVLDGKRLSRIFFIKRWDTKKHMIASRLRCSRCGRRPERYGLTWKPAEGPAWGPKTERDWQRLMARLRG